MNEHILFVMRSLDNTELFTQEEKVDNRQSADAADAAADAADAAYTTSYASAAYAAYASAATYAATYASAADDASTEWWVKKFFERAGEDKQTYIDEVERLKG